jgi:acyl-coenzyme A thioesterase PaaI-like protein
MAEPILDTFRRFHAVPGGPLAFDAGVALAAPFNSAVAPRVKELAPGSAVVEMKDRPWRRNHLGSLHAMALGTLAEITANLTLLASLPKGAQMIPTNFQIEFVRKARGTVTARCAFDVNALTGRPTELVLSVELTDASGAVVARTRQTCRLKWGA